MNQWDTREVKMQEEYKETEDFRFTMSLMEDTEKSALVALYYTALTWLAESDNVEIFDVHNDIIDAMDVIVNDTKPVH